MAARGYIRHHRAWWYSLHCKMYPFHFCEGQQRSAEIYLACSDGLVVIGGDGSPLEHEALAESMQVRLDIDLDIACTEYTIGLIPLLIQLWKQLTGSYCLLRRRQYHRGYGTWSQPGTRSTVWYCQQVRGCSDPEV